MLIGSDIPVQEPSRSVGGRGATRSWLLPNGTWNSIIPKTVATFFAPQFHATVSHYFSNNRQVFVSKWNILFFCCPCHNINIIIWYVYCVIVYYPEYKYMWEFDDGLKWLLSNDTEMDFKGCIMEILRDLNEYILHIALQYQQYLFEFYLLVYLVWKKKNLLLLFFFFFQRSLLTSLFLSELSIVVLYPHALSQRI